MSWPAAVVSRPRRTRALLLARQISWPALLWVAALVADAWCGPPASGFRWLWIDVAALAALAWALLRTRGDLRERWATCVDGRVFAGLVLSALQWFASRGEGESGPWLRHILPAIVFYYALAARLRAGARPSHAAWPAFAFAAFALGAAAIGLATRGMTMFAASVARVDALWLGHQTFGKALVFVTVLCAGRAVERDARPLWRAATLVGAIGCLLLGMSGGWGMRAGALARLDDPLYFSLIAVLLFVLATFMRLTWCLRREREAERGRWTAMAIAFALVAVMGVLGGTTGGEGLRSLAALAAATTFAAYDARAIADGARPREIGEDSPALDRAA